MNKQQEIAKDLINKMFEIAGHTARYEDMIGRQDNWFQQYTMTTNKFSGVFMEKDNLIREEFLHAIAKNGVEF